MPAAAWDLPTHAPGWAVRDQVSHLASTDEDATLAIVDPAEFTARTERRRTTGEEPRGTFLERGRSPTAAALQSEGVVGKFLATRPWCGCCGRGASVRRLTDRGIYSTGC